MGMVGVGVGGPGAGVGAVAGGRQRGHARTYGHGCGLALASKPLAAFSSSLPNEHALTLSGCKGAEDHAAEDVMRCVKQFMLDILQQPLVLPQKRMVGRSGASP